MVKGNQFTLGRGQILCGVDVKLKASPLPLGEGKRFSQRRQRLSRQKGREKIIPGEEQTLDMQRGKRAQMY